MATAPPLPLGWQWHFDDVSQRWAFLHLVSNFKQFVFPNAGDELVRPDYSPPQPISKPGYTQQSAVGHDIASVTASMASVSVQTPVNAERKVSGSVKRKPVGPKKDAQPVATLPENATSAEANKTEYFGSAPPSYVANGGPAALQSSAVATPASAGTPSTGLPTSPLSLPPYSPYAPNPQATSPVNGSYASLPALAPVQTAPPTVQVPQPQRPSLPSIPSAPQVLQSDQTHTVEQAASTSSKSKMSRFSRGVGTWVQKHPKMAIGGAVLVEAAGLAAGVDVLKDAAFLDRTRQRYKAKQNAGRIANTQPSATSTPGQQQQAIGNTQVQSPAASIPQSPHMANNSGDTYQNVQTMLAAHQQAMNNLQAQLSNANSGLNGGQSQPLNGGLSHNAPNEQSNIQVNGAFGQQQQAAQNDYQQQLINQQQQMYQQQSVYAQQLAQQQSVYAQQLAQQQNNSIQQQSVFSQLMAQQQMYSPCQGQYAAAQQPMYIDNSNSGSSDLTSILMLAALNNSSSGTSGPTATAGVAVADPTQAQAQAVIDPYASQDTTSVDPSTNADLAAQTALVQAQLDSEQSLVLQENEASWATLDSAASLELI